MIIPILNVTAKPLIGPVPIAYRISATNRVVTFASIIVLKALAKPFKGKIDTDKEKLVSENGKTMVVQKAKGGSIQVSGTNFSGVY